MNYIIKDLNMFMNCKSVYEKPFCEEKDVRKKYRESSQTIKKPSAKKDVRKKRVSQTIKRNKRS